VEIITDISRPLNLKNPVITIGTFDGVHLGHRVILNKVIDAAKENGSDSVLVTFNPHPRIILRQQVALLNTRNEKREILRQLGLSHLVEIPFTTEFADLDADSFIKLLVDLIKPSMVVIGYDHGFGRNRSGNIEQLEQAGKKLGFSVLNVDAIQADEYKVSSSIIRSLLMEGHVKKAGELLGQPYQISGQVVRGNQIGKRIGFPTANLQLEDPYKLIPGIGVYASYVTFNNQVYEGMTNIGLRPTINAHQLTIETNIFEFDRDIYYERLTINMIDRIRNERKFGSLDILKNQLAHDRDKTKLILQKLD
jgi:riboflavin kinase/FMN adenylyltransferase